MAKNFKNLKAKMGSARRAAVDRKISDILAKMPLNELRTARGLTQAQLAETLDMKQSSVSKLERQADMYVGTLRRFIEALGGQLRIVVEFPDGEVVLDQFTHPAIGRDN